MKNIKQIQEEPVAVQEPQNVPTIFTKIEKKFKRGDVIRELYHRVQN